MTEKEKQHFKMELIEKMDEFLIDVNNQHNNIGWMPDDLYALMAEAAFNVLIAVQKTNEYLKEQDLLKD